MKRFFSILIITLSITISSMAQTTKSVWPVMEKQMKPWVRWWWMGSAVDEKNLIQNLTTYQKAGIGGVEITPIYGAVGYEARYIDFLSPKWMDMLRFTVNKSTSLGLGVDMNTGTGWPFGGPQIKPENAATKLITQKYNLKEGEKLNEPIKVKEAKQEVAKLQALTAYGPKGEILNLLNQVEANGNLNWSPNKGNWEIYALFAGKTRQMVKRAAPGGEGFTLDHLDKSAVNVYLKRFNDAFGNKPQGIRSFFNDSYEVYGANWTPTFFDEFKKNRGYDLRNYLRELVGDDGNKETIARVKSDYRETMNDLLLNNFTKPWTNWAHQYQSLTKNQSHGSPGNLLDLYSAVDIPETETFGSSYFPISGLRRNKEDIRNVNPDPMMSKFASSAAHTTGKKLVSSETFTWLTEHFKTSFSQCKPEAEQLFLSGVNHIFYHGTTNSPSDAVWPGWLFYASVQMNPTNSLWPQIGGLNNYIARCQSVLQAGKADNELLIYWPVYDVWNQAKGLDIALKVHDVDDWLHPTPFYKLATSLSKTGYSFDFASDHLLSQSTVANGLVKTAANASPYKVLIVPQCEMMDLNTLNKIITMANAGATVIFQELPKDVPGLNDLSVRQSQLKTALGKLAFVGLTDGIKQFKTGKGQILLASDIQKALTYKTIKREELTDSGLQFIRRAITGGKYYYVVNHTAKAIDAYLPVNESGYVLFMDPLNGTYGLAATKVEKGQLKTRFQLKSGESIILKITKAKPAVTNLWNYLQAPGTALAFTNPWSLHFSQGGPALPADQKLEKLISWTELPDEKLKSFSGTGVYTTSFNLPAKNAKEYVLSLNQVDESARVFINGQEVGILWSIPFEAKVGKFLKVGNNTIKIEVVNLMANRIRDMDIKKIKWRNYHEINFVDINYKDFDAAKWDIMPSGLLGPITITPYN
ncbi:glycoside hydrolase [Pedobacter frigiditerrae]|uniref:Glycoside hydrolase n=1 Tax=Pedobacter frigiditerrae TaxID=2530452 RepID=A0A4R0MWW5_9SPHI|nr:glycosyl hydrolase [Pedobacter frigiditerrae]TCC91759.1 glycoside hydrolase [Pedobacter frigiditerrae]